MTAHPSQVSVKALVAQTGRAHARTLRLAVLSAVAAALAGSPLLGLSGWFLTGAGLAGLAGPQAARAFNYLVPSAFIRLAAVVRTAGRYGERLLAHQAALRTLADVRTSLLGTMARLDPRLARPLSTGEAAARLTGDIDAIEARMVQEPQTPAALAATAVAVLLTAWASPVALPVLLVALVALPRLADRVARRFVDHPAATAQRLQGELKAELAELLAAGTELSVYGLTDAATDGARTTAAGMDAARRSSARGAALTTGLVTLAGPLLAAIVLVAGAGNAALVAAAALCVLVAAEALAGPLRFRLEQGRLEASLSSLEALSLETGAPAARLAPGLAQPLRIAGIELPAGAILVITGRSGSGKTRLVETLGGLRSDAPERLEIGGFDPRLLAFADIRSQFGHAPQDPVLLAGTLEDNLRLARPGLSEADLWSALETACLADEVRLLPEGLQSWLGDGGARLSGGQRKRLALARALLAGRPWLLLDEPSEGLDEAVEARLTVRLADHLRTTGTGAIIATHRPRLALLATHRLNLG